MNAGHTRAAVTAAALMLAVLGGCNGSARYEWDPEAFRFRRVGGEATTRPAERISALGPARPVREIPNPINLLLPREVRIHPFTGTRTFSDAGGINGFEVQIEAQDSYGDATKAFGQFRFELHTHTAPAPDPKGRRIAVWEVDLLTPKVNLTHWNPITRRYTFRLQWDTPIPVGRKFVLVTVFSSPFTERLFAERVFVSGQ